MDAKLQAHLTELIPKLLPHVMRYAQREKARAWPPSARRDEAGGVAVAFDRDDVTQEMWLTACEHEELLLKHLAAGNTRAMGTVLERGARQMVAREMREVRAKKAALEGYEPHDEQFYSIPALRRLLPMYLDGGVQENRPAGRELTGRVSGGASGGYGDYMAVMADVDVAFKSLPEGKRKLLARYFAYPQGSGGFTHVEIAGRMGIPPGQLTGRVHYALRALQNKLGGAP